MKAFTSFAFRDCKELVIIQSWLRNSEESQMAQLSGLDQLKIISLNFGSSKYSVFDSLRRREEKGDYLGWSKDILGEREPVRRD